MIIMMIWLLVLLLIAGFADYIARITGFPNSSISIYSPDSDSVGEAAATDDVKHEVRRKFLMFLNGLFSGNHLHSSETERIPEFRQQSRNLICILSFTERLI